ncbi:hypothetical protein [Corynebacterium terpenotabidum]|uniref:Uncharacterized protein n=1 Tax=Corynebacterium terpenotabidum Y-11 TaxID=1200352 RepID=S4XEN9_9CORY|nr:hypothetical protein [Corynebacterium terpenotabidum]AGP31029.1 hypothetical protein A606_06910 [Corynebacterium terpenotabidum Y-11]
MLYTDTVDHPTIEEITVYPLNRAELRMADAYVGGRPSVERQALEQAVRGRGTAYVARFRHTGEMSWRMPVLFSAALADGRMTIDHFDTLWRRLDRHAGVRQEIDDQIIRREDRAAERARRELLRAEALAAGEPPPDWSADGDYNDDWSGYNYGEPAFRLPEPENGRCSHIDQVVEREVMDWLQSIPQRMSTRDGSRTVVPAPSVSVHRLRDVVDRAATDAVEELARLRDESLDWAEEADRRREEAAVKAREDADRRARRRAERAAKKAAKDAEKKAAAAADEAENAAAAGQVIEVGPAGPAPY